MKRKKKYSKTFLGINFELFYKELNNSINQDNVWKHHIAYPGALHKSTIPLLAASKCSLCIMVMYAIFSKNKNTLNNC